MSCEENDVDNGKPIIKGSGRGVTQQLYTYTAMSQPTPLTPSRTHLTRLMKVWRSAGWPCRDPIEIDLIAAGWVSVVITESGHETLRLTQEGIQVLAASRQRNLRATSRHDRLARLVARQLNDAGRVVWLELMLRAQVKGDDDVDEGAAALSASEALPDLGLWAPVDVADDIADEVAGDITADHATVASAAQTPAPKAIWRMARPDVFSVRHTSVENYLQPVVHEIKVSRADLLSDLRHAAKREAYRWLCSACYYVFPVGIAKPNEIPEEFGVWVLHGDVDTGRLEQLRPARHAPCKLPFAVWMALAKSTPWRADPDESQALLGAPGDTPNADIANEPADR